MLLALWLGFAAAPPVLTPTGPILDHAELFSPNARGAAQERLQRIREQFGYEMWIETVKQQPSTSDLSGLIYRQPRLDRLRMWVRERARASNITKGLYVIVSLDPPDVRLAGEPVEAEQRLPWSRREEVRVGMRKFLRAGDYDRALAEAVDRFNSILAATTETKSPFTTLPLLAVMGGLVGGWLVLCLIRRGVLGLTSPMYPPASQGGIFGVPVASWIYDRLYRPEKT